MQLLAQLVIDLQEDHAVLFGEFVGPVSPDVDVDERFEYFFEVSRQSFGASPSGPLLGSVFLRLHLRAKGHQHLIEAHRRAVVEFGKLAALEEVAEMLLVLWS